VRILYINTLYSPHLVGGAERVVQAQAEAMAAAGHEVGVLSISPEPGLNLSHVNGLPIWRAGIRNLYFHFDEIQKRRTGRLGHAMWHLVDSYNPFMAQFVRQVSREFNPDAASCHNLPGWSISAWDALAAERIPIVQVLHDQYLLCPTSGMYRDGKRCANQCMPCRTLRLPHRRKSTKIDTLVGVSSFICNKLVGNEYFEGIRRIKVIPNIRDITTENIPEIPREDDGMIVFGYIGRLSEPKGVEVLLDTFIKFHRAGWKLLIAGSGEAGYEAMLRKKFQHPQIEFTGHVSPNLFFSRLDFTVVPSLWEDTFPSVIFESLLYGRPVLGSNLGGIPEMLNEGNGRFFSPGDSADLMRGMQGIAEEKAFFRDRFEAIRQEAVKYCNKEWWVSEWCDVYSSAIEAARSLSLSRI
jgi:glycosyltransferase involved in cell wall biosynthesis